MLKKTIRILSVGAIIAAGATFPTNSADAATVARGFDLLKTTEALVFFPDGSGGVTQVDLLGVPFENFTFPKHPLPLPEYTPPYFGQSVRTRNADTIVHRLEEANAPVGGSATIPIEMVGLQLISDGEITIGGSTNVFYFTQSLTKKSSGSMSITFLTENSGLFSSELDIWFDIRIGGFDGAIVRDFNKKLVMNNSMWDREVKFQIPGVNYRLNGMNSQHDFAPRGVILHDSGDGFTHGVVISVPEPATWAMLIAGFGLVGSAARRRRARASA